MEKEIKVGKTPIRLAFNEASMIYIFSAAKPLKRGKKEEKPVLLGVVMDVFGKPSVKLNFITDLSDTIKLLEEVQTFIHELF